MPSRTLRAVIPSIPASDGAGVKLRRSLGQAQHVRLDPFLMLDEFFSDNPEDYLAGFPDHPHRGFETVTYILDGHMLHEDHLGNRGDLKAGGVQWMTAGRGIVHSEMPQQTEGRMRGFQLWINLPGKEKMKPAGYKDLQPEDIPEVALEGGGKVRVIGGAFGARASSVPAGSTDVTYLDVHLPAGGTFRHAIPDGHNVFVYPYEGELSVGGKPVRRQSAGVLSQQGDVELQAGGDAARFLLLAGKPIGEPVVQYGPFVMNTVEEIQQTLRDYQDGAFVR
ncbi:MAG TPA: pirin family protein [Burkholderiales bacterium]|nr:pirin family protein [Burkholderiales bacterium]